MNDSGGPQVDTHEGPSQERSAGAEGPYVELVAARALAVREQLDRWGGAEVEILPVTKGLGLDAVLAAQAAGFTAVGENYATELTAKAEQLQGLAESGSTTAAVNWHLIGPIQRRTIGRVASLVACWQTVAREEEAASLGKASPGARVYVQVNPLGDPTKSGVAPDRTEWLVTRCGELGLRVEGLMTIGVADDFVATRQAFSIVSALRESLGLAQLSMGMSQDLRIAVECGSTQVRVGTAIFGARAPRNG